MRKRVDGMTQGDLDQLAVLFRLLSDKTRLSILMLLTQGERNVTALCRELSLPQPTVSHHLGLLRMNNLIVHRRNGKQVFYGLSNDQSDGWAGDDLLQVGAEQFCVRVAPRGERG